MDLAQEVGYLRGMQEATQKELTRLATAQENTSREVADVRSDMVTKHDLGELRTELNTKIDDAVTKLQGSSGVQQAAANQSIIAVILKSQITPTIVTVLAMVAVMIVVFSRETGRAASTFVPYPAAALPPGGSATTTVTAPAKDSQ